jgi:hypothetical protein
MSIKVLSRSLPRKSLFTSPTLLKSLSVGFAGITTVSRVSSPRVPEKKNPGFFEDFFPSFLVRKDPVLLSSADAYCCTYREDVGNRLPLC